MGALTTSTAETDWDTEKKRLLFSERERRGYLLYGAWAGTILAGGAFGVMLFFWEVVMDEFPRSTIDSISDFLVGFCQVGLGSILGFIIGAIWSGSIGAMVAGATLAVIAGMGLKRTPVWFASTVGAWTAFFCCGSFVWVPIMLGQAGAQYVGLQQTTSKANRIFPDDKGEEARRFGLGLLFRFTTVACVVMAILSLLPLEDAFRLQMAYCLAWQIVSILLVLGARSVWAKRST